MVRIKPFRAVRPPKEHASEVASRPYDVLNSAEAKAEAMERSLQQIIRLCISLPETDFFCLLKFFLISCSKAKPCIRHVISGKAFYKNRSHFLPDIMLCINFRLY